MKLLGLDPGGTTGYAVIEINDKKAKLLNASSTRDTTLLEIRFLFEECDIIIYETFLVDPTKAMTGGFNRSDMVAPRVIGAIQLLAQLNGKVLVAQAPAIKPVGYGFAGLKYVKGAKGMHTQDAIAHCMFYGVSKKLCLPLDKNRGK